MGRAQASAFLLLGGKREESHWEGSPAPCKTKCPNQRGQAFSPPHPILLSTSSISFPSFFSSFHLFVLFSPSPCYACMHVFTQRDIALAPATFQRQCCKLRMQRQKVKSYSLGLVEGGTGRWQAGARSDIWQRELTGKSPGTFRGSESPSKMWETVGLGRENS